MIGTTSHNKQTRTTEPLARGEEYDLILRYKNGDERAIRQLICKYRNLIYKAVSRYGSQVDSRILISAGETAVHIAAKGFDLDTGTKFPAYLFRIIQTEVRDCYCDETGLKRRTLEHLGKISKASAVLQQKLGREATLEEIAEHSKLSQEQILSAWERKDFAQPYSLNLRSAEDGSEWLDFQIDETADPWDTSEEYEILDTLHQLENRGYLQSRQVTILIAKHQGYQSGAIGEQLGVSGERVRQLVRDAEKTLVALKEGFIKLRPAPAETTIPVSPHHNSESIGEGDQLNLDLPASEAARKPVVKRVDASRLGGRIGRAIKQIFNHTKEGFDYQLGEPAHDQKPILAFRRCSDDLRSVVDHHRIAPKSGHQSTSANQRCRGLGGIQDAWGGYLEIGQEILSVFLMPLAFAYLAIRGFQKNRLFPTRRSKVQFIATDIYKFLRMGYGRGHPRPPNHWPDTDEDSF